MKLLFLAIAAPLLLTGCKSQEMNDIAKAQACMDQINSSNYASATDCMQYVAKYSSQQANILKCAITLASGGLTTDRISAAYKTVKDSTATNKESVYVGLLALSAATPAQAYSLAQDAIGYCEDSGVPGNIFIANMALMGSAFQNLSGGAFSTDPATLQTQISSVLSNCQSSPSSCDPAVIGGAALTVATSYCDSNSADQDVCNKINEAVDSAGGDPSMAAEALYCLLDDMTWNSSSNTCN